MKKLLFLSLTYCMTVSLVNSQNNQEIIKCATDEYMSEMFQNNPNFLKEYQDLNQEVYDDLNKGDQSNKNQTTIIVPTVVHVIHINGSGNISEAQVIDGLNIINNDLKRLNSDTGDTRSIFTGVAGAMDIEFRLARKDPNGDCTNGIVRVNSALTNQAGNNVKSLSYWPSDQYFNIWLVNSIFNFTGGQGIILGYAQFPGNNASTTYGVVNRNDRWGSIGSATDDGRTATHEVGHCLNLYHTFQSGCGSMTGNCLNQGDEVCDTPPVISPSYSCGFQFNTCNNDSTQANTNLTTNLPDQIENYMSYNSCQNMFSQGQVNRMQSVLVNSNFLANLVSPSNNIATGTDDAYFFTAAPCIPIPEFISYNQKTCEGYEISFVDLSYNGVPDSTWVWNWNFPGGSPSTSSEQNPVIQYDQVGTYDVSLSVTNNSGTSTIFTRNDYISIEEGSGSFIAPESESFEDVNFPLNNDQSLSWQVTSTGPSPETWERTENAFVTGPASVYLNNFNIPAGNDELHNLISPVMDLTQMSNPIMSFYYAYARKTDEVELFQVFYSEDCGSNWNLLKIELSINLYTAPNQALSEFIPTSAGEWDVYSLDLSSLGGRDNIMIKLEFKARGGNNIYIDDFTIADSPLSSFENDFLKDDDVKIYPNPNNGRFVIDSEDIQMDSYRIFNSIGQLIMTKTEFTNSTEIDLGNKKDGIYFIELQSKQSSIIKKFIIE